MDNLKLKRRLVFLALATAFIFALTPSALVLAGEPGSGCAVFEGFDVRYYNQAYHGTIDAERDDSTGNATFTIDVASSKCSVSFEYGLGPFPSEDYCINPDPTIDLCDTPCSTLVDLPPGQVPKEICLVGWNTLTAQDISDACVQYEEPPDTTDPPDCVPDGRWFQIIAVLRLDFESDGDPDTFTADVVMREIGLQ